MYIVLVYCVATRIDGMDAKAFFNKRVAERDTIHCCNWLVEVHYLGIIRLVVCNCIIF